MDEQNHVLMPQVERQSALGVVERDADDDGGRATRRLRPTRILGRYGREYGSRGLR